MKHNLLIFLSFILIGNSAICSDFEDELKLVLYGDSLSNYNKRERIATIILEKNDDLTRQERLQQAYPIVREFDNPDYMWKWYVAYNLTLNEEKNYAEASDQAYHLLDTAIYYKNDSWKADVYFLLYDIHLKLNMPGLAKANLKDALDCAIRAQDKESRTKANYILGYVYYSEGKNDSAAIYLENVLNHDSELARINRNTEYSFLLARVYIRSKKFEKAVPLLRRVENGSQSDAAEYFQHYYHAGARFYLSHVFAMQGQMDSCYYYNDLAMNEYASFDSVQFINSSIYNAQLFLQLEEYQQALDAISFIEQDEMSLFMSKLKGNIHEGLKNYKLATAFYGQAIDLSDSTHKEVQKEMRETLELKSKNDLKTQKEIAAKKQELAKQQTASERQQKQIIIISGIIIVFVIAFFVYMLLNRFKVIRQQKNEIDIQHMRLEEKNREMLDSINYAQRIQNAILPSQGAIQKHLKNAFIFYKPKDVVAGDFYWLHADDEQVLFAAADCTGHGVPGAMVSVVCHNALNRSVREYNYTKPNDILNKTREIVVHEFEQSDEDVRDGMDIALCSLKGKKLEFSGAHNPLWIVRNEELIQIKGDKQPVGKFEFSTSFNNHSIELEKDDMIYVFSDGIIDQFGGEKGKKFKAANFRKLLKSIANLNITEQRKVIEETFDEWRGNLEQLDDICVIGLRV